MQQLTVLMKQTRQVVRAVKQSKFLDVYGACPQRMGRLSMFDKSPLRTPYKFEHFRPFQPNFASDLSRRSPRRKYKSLGQRKPSERKRRNDERRNFRIGNSRNLSSGISHRSEKNHFAKKLPDQEFSECLEKRFSTDNRC